MKSLKILSAFFAIFFLATTASFAQSEAPEMSDEQKAEMKKNMEAFQAALKLTEDQKTEFVAVSQKYAKQMMAVKEAGGSKMSMYKKVKSIRKNRNAEMKKLLSKDQYEVYLEKQEEMQKKMRARQG